MKPEVRFFQSGVRDHDRRMDRMEIHARISNRPVTIITDISEITGWKTKLKGTNVRVLTPYRAKGEQLKGLVLVDQMSSQLLLELHKLVIKQGAEFSVVDMRDGQ